MKSLFPIPDNLLSGAKGTIIRPDSACPPVSPRASPDFPGSSSNSHSPFKFNQSLRNSCGLGYSGLGTFSTMNPFPLLIAGISDTILRKPRARADPSPPGASVGFHKGRAGNHFFLESRSAFTRVRIPASTFSGASFRSNAGTSEPATTFWISQERITCGKYTTYGSIRAN